MSCWLGCSVLNVLKNQVCPPRMFSGTNISVKMLCSNGHEVLNWCSQQKAGKLFSFNLLLCSSIVFSGICYYKLNPFSQPSSHETSYLYDFVVQIIFNWAVFSQGDLRKCKETAWDCWDENGEPNFILPDSEKPCNSCHQQSSQTVLREQRPSMKHQYDPCHFAKNIKGKN